MAATRTQIYLSKDQRGQLDELRRETGASLAELIRQAVDEYLDREAVVDLAQVLDATFGAAPDASVPPREEWDRSSSRFDV